MLEADHAMVPAGLHIENPDVRAVKSGATRIPMLSIRLNRLAMIVAAATLLAPSGPVAAQTPDHPTETAQFPSAKDLRTMTTSGSYLAARHASVERDAMSAATFYRSALRTDPKN